MNVMLEPSYLPLPLLRSISCFLTVFVLATANLAQAIDLPPSPGRVGPIFRDPVTGEIKPVPKKSGIHICGDRKKDPACEALSLQQALDLIVPGGTVFLHPGEYQQAAYVRQHGTHIRAFPGAELVGATVGGKGALVIQANDTVIEGLACSAITVPDRNGACIRLEGANLTLRQVHFYDAEQGMLTGKHPGRVLIEDSRFENLGKTGRAHGIYVGGGELTVRRSLFLSSRSEGHEIKSRALRTVVEDSLIASLDGNDSYLIDISNGGEAIIRRNILHEGPNSVNNGAIAFGMEGIRHENSRLTIAGNLILMDRPQGTIVFAKAHNAIFEQNVVIGYAGGYAFGAVSAVCGQAGNICASSYSEAQRRANFTLPPIGELGSLLAQTGLLR